MTNNCPKGFIELHFNTGKSVLINVNMISFIADTNEENKSNNRNCHIFPIGHNNGGFYVKETYNTVIKAIKNTIE